VYNYRLPRGGSKSSVFSASSHSGWHMLIRCAGDLAQASAYSLSVDCMQATGDRFAIERRDRRNIPAAEGSRGATSAAANDDRRALRTANPRRTTHPTPFPLMAAFGSSLLRNTKPMTFQRNGYAGRIRRVSDIDIAGTCFSLAPRTGPPGLLPAQRPRRLSWSER
jgi:hypothetical protein